MNAAAGASTSTVASHRNRSARTRSARNWVVRPLSRKTAAIARAMPTTSPWPKALARGPANRNSPVPRTSPIPELIQKRFELCAWESSGARTAADDSPKSRKISPMPMITTTTATRP